MNSRNSVYLNGSQNRGFNEVLASLGSDILSGGRGTTVESQKSRDIELGSLEDLDLTSVGVLERVDTLTGLLDADSNGILGRVGSRAGNLGNKFLEVTSSSLFSHDLKHLLADLTDLSSLGIGGLLDLVATTSSERDTEETNEVTVGGLDIDKGLDQSLPLLDHGTELVGGHIHTVEVGETVLTLDFVHLELDLAERAGLVLGKITERHLDDTAVQGVVGVTETLGTVDQSLTDLTDLEHGGSLDIIPVLTGEGVDAKGKNEKGQ
jgi:hypothetical protein